MIFKSNVQEQQGYKNGNEIGKKPNPCTFT